MPLGMSRVGQACDRWPLDDRATLVAARRGLHAYACKRSETTAPTSVGGLSVTAEKSCRCQSHRPREYSASALCVPRGGRRNSEASPVVLHRTASSMTSAAERSQLRVVDELDDLCELDVGSNTVESRDSLQEFIGKNSRAADSLSQT